MFEMHVKKKVQSQACPMLNCVKSATSSPGTNVLLSTSFFLSKHTLL